MTGMTILMAVPVKKTATRGSTHNIVTADENARKMMFSSIVEYIVWLCSFDKDSIMVKCILQDAWYELHHVTSLSMADIDQLYLLKNDGTWDAKPLKMHVRMLQAFLLYYKRMCREAERILDEHDVMSFIRSPFHEYMSSDDEVHKKQPKIVDDQEDYGALDQIDQDILGYFSIKGNKIVCCQEADFIEFKDLYPEQQKEIIQQELNENQRSYYVNRSITEKERERSR
jgi:hypothetical protein